MPGQRAWLFSVVTFAAAALALYIAFETGLERPYWAATTVYIVAQGSAGALRAKALWRLIGTFAGAGIAVLALPAPGRCTASSCPARRRRSCCDGWRPGRPISAGWPWMPWAGRSRTWRRTGAGWPATARRSMPPSSRPVTSRRAAPRFAGCQACATRPGASRCWRPRLPIASPDSGPPIRPPSPGCSHCSPRSPAPGCAGP
ncbi:MAG: hypothetical protein EON47_06675, partial [Acetobacteraceae bacterium]